MPYYLYWACEPYYTILFKRTWICVITDLCDNSNRIIYFLMCECGFLGTSSTILYLCISLETGPRCPNPDAMLLISTCFQEQYGVCLAHWFSVCGQRDSSIMSERSIPSDIGYATQHILHDIWTPTVSMNMSVIQTLPHMQKRFSNSKVFFFISI